MSDSIFQKIIKRELPSTIIFEDDEFIVIKNIYPKAPVHVLVIPKTPYESLESVDFDDDLFYAKLLKTARKAAQQLGISKNYKLFMNVGKKVQEIHHLHLHLMGGYEDQADHLEFKE